MGKGGGEGPTIVVKRNNLLGPLSTMCCYQNTIIYSLLILVWSLMVPGTIACPGGMGSCSMLSQLVEPLFVSLFRDCTGNPPLYRALEHAMLFDVSELTATFGSNEVY